MAIALVQSVVPGFQSSAPFTATFTTSNTTIGDIGVMQIWWNGSGTQTTGTITITDTQGNTWTLIPGTFAQFSDSSSGNKLGVVLAWCRYSGATKNKVTVAFSQSVSFININQLEFSGLVSSGSPVDAANSNSVSNVNSNSPWTTGNITVANANSLAIGYMVTGGGPTGSGAIVPASGFTAIDNNNAAGFLWCGEYNLAIASGTQNGNFSRASSSAQYGACIASFIPAGVTPSTKATRTLLGVGL